MIPAIVLAAGRSARMGRAKALLPIAGGETFLSRVIKTLIEGGVDDVVVVLGYEPEPIVADLASRGLAARYIVNENFDAGQLSSLVTGLRVIDRPGIEAALVTLVDVPLVRSATVRAVVDRYRRARPPIVRPVCGDRHGHPLLIDRGLFGALRSADPSVGAKEIVRAHASKAGDVEVNDEGAFRDVDCPEEYERLLRELDNFNDSTDLKSGETSAG